MADKVSHDDLSAAWDSMQPDESAAAEQEPTEEETQTEETEEQETPAEEPDASAEEEPEESEEVPEEPEDNAERSKLGRKVAEMQAQMEALADILRKTQTPQQPQEEEEEFDDDAPIYKKDLDRYLELREKRAAAERANYQSDYQTGIVLAGKDLPIQEHDQIIREIGGLPKRANTGNAKMDAQLDWMAAENFILRKKVETAIKPNNPLNKNKDSEPEAPLGGGADTKNDTKPARMPRLDKDAAAFVKHTGMDAERVQKVLSGEAPLNLVNPKAR